jgi:DNA modification methylase
MIQPYYQDDTVTLYNADCLDVMREMEAESVDIIWTDPPYGHNNNNNDLIHRVERAIPSRRAKGDDGTAEYEARPIINDGPEEMRAVMDGMLIEAARVLRQDCCCCCCCCGGGGPKPTFAWVANRMDEKGLSFFHAVIWDKGGLGMGWRYRRNYEMVMVAHRRGGKLKWETTSSGIDTANVVRIPKIIPTAIDHPTPKPVALPLHFLALHGKAGDVVLDPFMGAGPTGVASVNWDCRFIGIELEEKYCEIAKRRIIEAKSQLRLAI